MENDRRDKFAYTSIDQIKFSRPERKEAPKTLRELIESENLDEAKVLALVREHLDELRR